MIKNDREYRITKAQAARFAQALAGFASSPGVDPRLARAQKEALQSQLDELLEQLHEYEALRSTPSPVVSLDSLEELPAALIRARIAAGLTQRQLAERLGLKEQQIQRYEATDYSSADFARLSEIARALGVRIREDLFLDKSIDLSEERLRQLNERVRQTVVAYLQEIRRAG
jgi:transcriptional regulator with XRE-family HTH domain